MLGSFGELHSRVPRPASSVDVQGPRASSRGRLCVLVRARVGLGPGPWTTPPPLGSRATLCSRVLPGSMLVHGPGSMVHGPRPICGRLEERGSWSGASSYPPLVDLDPGPWTALGSLACRRSPSVSYTSSVAT